jgi:hypothetical protein
MTGEDLDKIRTVVREVIGPTEAKVDALQAAGVEFLEGGGIRLKTR